MRHVFRLLVGSAASLVFGTALVPLAHAQTFDPSDPYRLVFLDQLDAMVAEAVPISLDWVKIRAQGGSPDQLDLSTLQRLNLDLQQELQVCGNATRREIEQNTVGLLQASFERPDRMKQLGHLVQLITAAYRTDLEAIDRLSDLLPADFLTLDDINGDGRLQDGEPVPSRLLDQAGVFLYRRGFFKSILAIGERLEEKNALSAQWEQAFYPRAMFFLGEVDMLRAYARDHEINLVDDWLITTALRAGAEDEARAIQQRVDQDDPDNLSRMLFFESNGAREAHCGNMLQSFRDSDRTNQLEEEADGSRTWFGSWRMLLCGEFADSRRAALKSEWANRRGSCAASQTNANLTNQYNAILSGVYQAADLRDSGARELSTELLDTVVAEVRQALFLDSFTAYSNLEVVIEDDIAIYMSRLHGPRPELSLVKGMLEQGRGELTIAKADFQEALRLSGVGPQDVIEAGMVQSQGLDIKWLLQLTEWIDEIDAVLALDGEG